MKEMKLKRGESITFIRGVLLMIRCGCKADNKSGTVQANRMLAATIIIATLLSLGAHQSIAKEVGQTAVKSSLRLNYEPTYVPGDRLKISFYESVGSDRTETSRSSRMSNLVEHTQLSGEYIVQLDGVVFIPLLGKIDVTEWTHEDLQKRLVELASATLTGRATVVVRTLSRQAIYVAGNVPRPGKFDYTPGMVVLNAILLAGMPRPGQDNWRRFDLARIKEHLRQSNAKLAELLAKRDSLVAYRYSTPAVASKALMALVGSEDAAKRIASAAALVRLQMEKRKGKSKSLNASLAALQKQRAILIGSLEDAAAALTHKTERLNSMMKLRRQRVITDNTYYEALSAVDNSKSRWNDLRASIAQLEHRIVEIRGKKSELIAEIHVAREQRIDELNSLVKQATVTRLTLAPAIGYDVNSSSLNKDQSEFTIIRRSKSGLKRLSANRFTSLRPGDILEIVTESRLRASVPNAGE